MSADPLFNADAQMHRLALRHKFQSQSQSQLSSTITTTPPPTLPALSALQTAEASLPDPSSPSYLAGQPHEDVARHITEQIVPALCGHAQASRYFGFVIGGVLPIAEWADNVVSRVDQNAHVNAPAQTVSTAVEDAALEMLVRLLRLDEVEVDDEEGGGTGGVRDWKGRIFTTGATGSNVLGLACGREAVLSRKLGDSEGSTSVGELGLLAACIKAGISEIQVLTSAGHSSLSKAASIVGLGRFSVKELPRSSEQPWKLDLDAVERELQRPGVASIIAVSAGEVNMGRWALDDVGEWKRLREMADRHGSWIHADGGKNMPVC